MRVILIILVILMTGCAATGPTFQKEIATPNESLVYVYRENNWFQALARPPLFVNNKKTCQSNKRRIRIC